MGELAVQAEEEKHVCQYIVKLLEKNFPGLENRIRLYFFSNISEEDMAAEDYQTYVKKDGYEILAERKEPGFRDSRINEWGRKSTAQWFFVSKYRSESMVVLAETILNELQEKFTDHLYFQRIREDIGLYEAGETDGRADYFFELVRDGEKLKNACAKKILAREGLPSWQMLVQISAQYYEKRPLNARLYFVNADAFGILSAQNNSVNDDDSDERSALILLADEEKEEKYQLQGKNLRTIRKIMEAAPDGQGILVNRDNGAMCAIADQKECEKLSRVYIQFQGHLNWKVVIDREEALCYCDGEYQFPGLGEMEPEYVRLLNESGISPERKEGIRSIIKRLSQQPHGTAIVFMEQSLLEPEVVRLSSMNRCHAVESIPLSDLTDDMLMGLTSIDGALMADLDGRCRGIGAILDGDAVVKGNPGRGARYNSLTNYVTQFVLKKQVGPAECFAIIFSEDRRVDLAFCGDLMADFVSTGKN